MALMYHQLNFSGNECTALAVKKLTCNPEETRQLYEAKKAQTLKLWNRSPPMLSKPNVQQLIGTCSKFVNEINSHICAANQTKSDLQGNVKYWTQYTIKDKALKDSEVTSIK